MNRKQCDSFFKKLNEFSKDCNDAFDLYDLEKLKDLNNEMRIIKKEFNRILYYQFNIMK